MQVNVNSPARTNAFSMSCRLTIAAGRRTAADPRTRLTAGITGHTQVVDDLSLHSGQQDAAARGARLIAGQLAETEERVADVEEQVAATNDQLAASRGDPKYRRRADQARQRAQLARRMAARERAAARNGAT